MTYISSDTNVWIDFMTIGRVDIPFRLPYTYIMNKDAIDDELISPQGLSSKLVSYGLIPVEITIEEFFLAEKYGIEYLRLSKYDRIALAIAKNRGIILLTGDNALRKAAKKENVSVLGTLGILDQLWEQERITPEELESCLNGLLSHNGEAVRLPKKEIMLRLKQVIKQ